MYLAMAFMLSLIVRALRPVTELPLDVHLMIVEPERSLETSADAGADVITIHPEATTHLQRSYNFV